MRHSGTSDISNIRRRPFAPPAPTPRDLQSLLAFAYLQEQRRRLNAEAEADRYREQVAAIFAVQRRLAELALSPDQLPEFIAQQAMAMTRASGAAVAMAEGPVAVCRGRAGESAPPLGAQVNPQSGLSAECLRTGDVLCCEDSETDARVQRAVCRELGIRSVLVVPIRAQQSTAGILEVFSPLVGAFGSREIRALELLSGLVTQGFRPVDASLPQAVPVPVPELPVAATLAEPETADALCDDSQPVVDVAAAAALFSSPEKADRAGRTSRWVLVGALALVGLGAAGLLVRGVVVRQHQPLVTEKASIVPDDRPPAAAPLTSSAAVAPSGPSVLSAVEFQYKPDSTTVTVDLSSPVRFEAQRLRAPERIYLDMPGARVAPELLGKNQSKTLLVNDKLLARVRVAQKDPDVARVVLDLNCACDFSAVVSTAPPYRLTVETRATGRASPDTSPGPAAPSTPSPASQTLPVSNDEVRTGSAGLKIVIDPGHGGWDRGTVGPSGLQEKDLVLDVARRLGDLLVQRLGAQAIYTRTDDTFIPLESRAAMANSAQADLFVSIHGNSSGYRSVRGVETFYMNPASAARVELIAATEKGIRSPKSVAASRQLAAAVQHALYTKLAADDPDLRDRGVKPAPLVVLVGPNMPSVLSEISFLSSPAEEQRLKTPKYRDRIAEALYEGIRNYVSRAKLRGSFLAAVPARVTPTKAQ